jgi:hypothetical protein
MVKRFIEKFTVGDGCWEWQRSLAPNGYGRFGVGGRKDGMGYAHRVSWSLFRGEIPKGLCVLHRCDNRKCVNPKHLFVGTLGDNNRDCVAKGRNSRGSDRPNAKLDLNKAHQIRKKYRTVSIDKLADEYGVSRNAIFQVASGRTWR